MSPTDRRAATSSGATTARGAARTASDRAARPDGGGSGAGTNGRHGSAGSGAGRSGDPKPSGPVELPEIVPATADGPETAVAPTEPDATDDWAQSTAAPVVVGTPSGASAPLRVRGRRPRVRKVTRVVRHIDPWSTFKVAAIFSIVLYGVLLTSGVLLWNVASNTGTIDNVERWFTQFGWETFELNGGEIYRNAWVGGLFGAVALTGLAVLLATLFNLVSDMVGGVRVTVLEEEVVERTTTPSRRYVVRRVPTEAAGDGGTATRPVTTDWSVDDPEPPRLSNGSRTPDQRRQRVTAGRAVPPRAR